MTGLGLIVGPIIGSVFYSYFGYRNTFYIYGSYLVLVAAVIKCQFPESKQSERLDELKALLLEGRSNSSILHSHFQSSVSIEAETTVQVGYCALLKEARFTLAALSSALCYFTSSFMEPILARRLIEFNLTQL